MLGYLALSIFVVGANAYSQYSCWDVSFTMEEGIFSGGVSFEYARATAFVRNFLLCELRGYTGLLRFEVG